MEHWRSLVRSLELSSAQHAELVTVYTAYRRLMARVLHERAQISATLREHGIVDTEAVRAGRGQGGSAFVGCLSVGCL